MLRRKCRALLGLVRLAVDREKRERWRLMWMGLLRKGWKIGMLLRRIRRWRLGSRSGRVEVWEFDHRRGRLGRTWRMGSGSANAGATLRRISAFEDSRNFEMRIV